MNAIKLILKKNKVIWILAYFVLLFLGLNIAIKQSPFYMPDEGAHFLRAWEVSQLHLINYKGSVGVDISCDEYVLIGKTYRPIAFFQSEAIEHSLEPKCSVRSINSAGSYSFVPYIPAALTLRFLTHFNTRIEDKLIYARIANFGFWFTILYFGLFLISKARLLFGCLLLMPSLFWQMVAVSADGATIASCYIYILLILKLSQSEQKLSLKALSILIGAAILVGASKGAYSFITLLSFSLWNKFGNASVFKRIIALISPLLFSLSFYFLLTVFVDPSQIYFGNGANPTQQIFYLIEHPFHLLEVMSKSLLNIDILGLISPTYAVPNIGRAYGIMITVLFTFLILLFRFDFGISKLFRWISGCLSLVMFASICLPLYLTYTPVGADLILGLQGRYYLPIFPLLFISVASDFKNTRWVELLKAAIRRSEWIVVFPILGLIVAAINVG